MTSIRTDFPITGAITGPLSEDWRAIREICCETGSAGNPIARERWPFFSELWIRPYERDWPEWARVARDGERVAGYLTGCPLTATYERRERWFFHPRLAALVLARRYPWNSDTRRFLKRFFRLEPWPNSFFGAPDRAKLAREYPAHLHVNVRADYRGAGLGAKLVEDYCARLAAVGVSGVHLFCGEKPVAFYRRCGFEELARLEFRAGVWIYCLGRRVE